MWYLFAFHLHFRRREQSWDSCVTRRTCVHSRNAREISRRSIGVVRVGGFRNNFPIAKDPCILFTKKVGTAKMVAVGDRNPDIEAALEFYENDLPSPHVVDVELLRWKRKWCSTEDADLSTSAVQTLAACDREFFPNIHTLIRILCTLPITSAECERSFSTLRRLKTYLRSTMSSERESGLALMNINYHRDINIEEVINTFAQRQPRRLLFA